MSRPPSADARDATRETALAARAYGRHGSADVHGFLRWGRHTGPSTGSAVSWVGSDSTELHASVRILRRHVAWTLDPAAGTTVVAADPWARQLRGPRAQALIGLQWMGQNQFGLLAEAWYDGTAPSVGEWRAWSQRLTALSASGAPTPARAGNLAWQATGFDRDNLHRLNVYLRLSWQAGGWQLYTDVLTQPADQGRQHTAGLQWQGNRLRLEAALRNVAGPADAVLHQLPVRRSAAMAATWSF